MANCKYCDMDYPDERLAIGYDTCMSCGEKDAHSVKHCIAPMHKSNYMLFTNLEDLKGINNKGGRYG